MVHIVTGWRGRMKDGHFEEIIGFVNEQVIGNFKRYFCVKWWLIIVNLDKNLWVGD